MERTLFPGLLALFAIAYIIRNDTFFDWHSPLLPYLSITPSSIFLPPISCCREPPPAMELDFLDAVQAARFPLHASSNTWNALFDAGTFAPLRYSHTRVDMLYTS
jgi:hypothetical protein